MNQEKISRYKKRIVNFHRDHKRMPSYTELTKIFQCKSKDTAFTLAAALKDIGFIDKDSQGKLIPGKGWNEVRMLGLVEAGFPSAAEQELESTISLDDFLIPNRESSYMLRVKGDSMIDAGIQEGDFVIVERGKNPRPGHIVIARVDGEFTLKYYRMNNGRAYLEAANARYKPIFPQGELVVEAVVTSVVRRY